MADVHRLPNVKEVEREASEWIARLNADEVSGDDRTRFEAWQHAHPLHAQTYEQLQTTWRRFADAGPLVRAVTFGQSMSPAAWSHRPRRWGWALAMTVVMATVCAGFYWQWLASQTAFKTAVGEQAILSLPDGSVLELNSNSLARVEYSARLRVIHLDRGEAFFKVAHDVNRPFWVTSGNSWVRAVGTAFDVYLTGKGLQITVSEGTIRIGSAARRLLPTTPSDDAATTFSAVLTPGQQAELSATAATTRKLSPNELARAVAWRSGTLYFEKQRLAEVVHELNRYTPRQVILEDEKLRALAVGGTFQTNPQGAEALVHLLEQGFEVSVRHEGDRILIRSTRHQ